MSGFAKTGQSCVSSNETASLTKIRNENSNYRSWVHFDPIILIIGLPHV